MWLLVFVAIIGGLPFMADMLQVFGRAVGVIEEALTQTSRIK